MKRTARAALRNRAAIADALAPFLPARGTVLEIGSGTGEHVLLLGERFPNLLWQPSDPDPEARASILAWTSEAGLTNVLPPLDLDVTLPLWRRRPADALLCVNVVHVTPPECAAALVAGAEEVLAEGAPLAIYGPVFHRGVPLAGRLARLDRDLRAHDPRLGVRELEALVEDADRHGFALVADREMPDEGDRLLVFRRTATPRRG